MINKAYKIINSAFFSHKYIRNPFVIFEIPLKKEIELVLKNNEKIKIKRRQFPLYISIFQNNWRYENGIFNNEKYKLKVIEPRILLEDFKAIYGNNLKDKNIIDIGGYCGETAIYFSKEEKAKKVFVYEPVKENFEIINENIRLNDCKNIITYNMGVSNKNGYLLIKSENPPGSPSFGSPGEKYSIKIPVESWNTILEKHVKDKIFMIKVDCEGGEKYLLETNKELIKTIPNWVIETHSSNIETDVIKLFESLGYKSKIKERSNKELSIWSFYHI